MLGMLLLKFQADAKSSIDTIERLALMKAPLVYGSDTEVMLLLKTLEVLQVHGSNHSVIEVLIETGLVQKNDHHKFSRLVSIDNSNSEQASYIITLGKLKGHGKVISAILEFVCLSLIRNGSIYLQICSSDWQYVSQSHFNNGLKKRSTYNELDFTRFANYLVVLSNGKTMHSLICFYNIYSFWSHSNSYVETIYSDYRNISFLWEASTTNEPSSPTSH